MNKHISDLYNRIKKQNTGVFLDCGFFRGEVTSALISELPNWKFFAFEINNDESKPYVEKVSLNYPNNFGYFNKAVYVKDDVIEWYKDLRPNTPNGSNISGKKFGLNQLDRTPQKTECFDLSKWIKSSFDKNDFIVLKLDIEGAEYEVLDHLINTDVISYINVLCVEWHPNLNVKNINIDRNKLPKETINWL